MLQKTTGKVAEVEMDCFTFILSECGEKCGVLEFKVFERQEMPLCYDRPLLFVTLNPWHPHISELHNR